MTLEFRPAGRRAGVVRAVPRPAAPRMRLTARGRLARQVAVLVASLAVVLLLAWQAVGAGPSAQERVVVQADQTLSHVAAEHLPGVPSGQAVLMLQDANGLGTTQVQAGQELVIPQP